MEEPCRIRANVEVAELIYGFVLSFNKCYEGESDHVQSVGENFRGFTSHVSG